MLLPVLLGNLQHQYPHKIEAYKWKHFQMLIPIRQTVLNNMRESSAPDQFSYEDIPLPNFHGVNL